MVLNLTVCRRWTTERKFFIQQVPRKSVPKLRLLVYGSFWVKIALPLHCWLPIVTSLSYKHLMFLHAVLPYESSSRLLPYSANSVSRSSQKRATRLADVISNSYQCNMTENWRSVIPNQTFFRSKRTQMWVNSPQNGTFRFESPQRLSPVWKLAHD